MRRKKTLSISDVLKEYKKEMKIDNKLKELEVVHAWDDIVGKAISRHTKRVYIKDKVLYVNLDSPVVRNELMMIRELIIVRINEKAGEEMVKEVILR